MRVSILSHLPPKTLEYSPGGEHTLTEDIPEQTAEGVNGSKERPLTGR